MDFEEKQETKLLLEEAQERLEEIDLDKQRSTEKAMVKRALANIRHSIGRIEGMIEVAEENSSNSTEDDN